MQTQWNDMPSQIKNIIDGSEFSEIHQGYSSSQVFKVVSREKGYFYLKINRVSQHFSFLHEIQILQWLHGKISVPEVVEYVRDDRFEYVVLTEIPGINCVEAMTTLDYTQIVKLLAEGLLAIHQLEISQCPFDESIDTKLKHAQIRLDHGLVDESDFDAERQGMTAQEIKESLEKSRPHEEDSVFTHGDYCLPNIILRNHRVSGYIDLGRAGISDRYNDLAIASRSICENLGLEYEEYFFKQYGIETIDIEKIAYYRMMDELF
ncbi:MAG: APH(3') family aminoglycoside O-phosphotransferase [Anaerolineae bacterium]|nr:APH(3') family aminoglycoside O-phosphotransferase [Anaerolineae bacterium]